MTAALAHRAARRAGAAALAVMLGAASMMLGAGAASAAPRQVECTIGASLPAPVTVAEGEQVQLVLVVPVLGTRVNVGPAQTPAPGTEVLSAAVEGVLGVVNGTLCQAAVQVQRTVVSAVPVPAVTVPTLPPVLPSQSVNVPLPGADVSVQTGGGQGTPGGGQPGTTPAPTAPPANPTDGGPSAVVPNAPSGALPSYRYDAGRIPMYDFTSVPYGVSTRFGAGAAPAFRFGQQLPGYAPQFGILGSEKARDDVADAGKVRALPLGGSGPVELPVLLAVLMLSTVSGALVRTWAMRRTA